jgi:DNA-binding transcriptional ArsR family regulator
LSMGSIQHQPKGKRGQIAVRTVAESLSVLFGASRARVLFAVRDPRTTAELASELRLAPSTVSGHLQSLRSAGVLTRVRHGRRVYYQLNAVGQKLLDVVGSRSARGRTSTHSPSAGS